MKAILKFASGVVTSPPEPEGFFSHPKYIKAAAAQNIKESGLVIAVAGAHFIALLAALLLVGAC